MRVTASPCDAGSSTHPRVVGFPPGCAAHAIDRVWLDPEGPSRVSGRFARSPTQRRRCCASASASRCSRQTRSKSAARTGPPVKV